MIVCSPLPLPHPLLLGHTLMGLINQAYLFPYYI